MRRVPSLVKKLFNWAALFLLALILCVVYYRLMTSPDAQYAQTESSCNFSTSSNDVCADAVRENRVDTKQWTSGYSVLTPARGYWNEVIRNPSLTSALVDTLKPACPAARRYVLESVEPDRMYFVRMCFKGAPSVNYHVRLLHIRRSSLHGLTHSAESVRRVAEPLDTHVMTVSMQCATGNYSALFKRKETTWCEAFDLSKGEYALRVPTGAGAVPDADPFLPVMEVTADVLTHTPYPELFPCLQYDIHLDTTVLNAVPPHAVAAAMPIVWFAFVMSLCTPWLLRRMQPSDDAEERAAAVKTN